MLDTQAEMWAVLCEPPEQFNDLIRHFDTVEFKKKFNSTSFTWNTIDPDEVMRKFRIACIEYAMAAAEIKVVSIPIPDYWQTVKDACQQVIDALNGNGDLVDARAAAAHAAGAAASTAAASVADTAYYAARDASLALVPAPARDSFTTFRNPYPTTAYAAVNANTAAAEADLFEIFINIILSEYENKRLTSDAPFATLNYRNDSKGMNMSRVLVKSGEYRNYPVIDACFELVKGFQIGAKGGYITVKNGGFFPVAIEDIKIKVNGPDDFEIDGEPIAAEVKAEETDEEAMNRIATRFEILDEMSKACINGDIRAMIVSGPPGVGKSFGVETQLEKASMFDKIAGNRIRYQVVKGAMTALGLYTQLYKYSDKKNILVFDDCDSVFMDDLALNILKAALDSGKRRKICWNSDSRVLREEGIPNSFNFNGSCIFITNLKFDNIKSKRLQDHLEALQSRCHFLDLTIDTARDMMLRIRQVDRDATGGLFSDYNFQNNEGEQVLAYMEANNNKLRELSIRMALKIADLIKMSPKNWANLAQSTCMKRG